LEEKEARCLRSELSHKFRKNQTIQNHLRVPLLAHSRWRECSGVGSDRLCKGVAIDMCSSEMEMASEMSHEGIVTDVPPERRTANLPNSLSLSPQLQALINYMPLITSQPATTCPSSTTGPRDKALFSLGAFSVLLRHAGTSVDL
jgi:hypothetical protein